MAMGKQAPKKKLIDHTREVIKDFSPKYLFSVQNIMDKLDAKGIKYSIGGLKTAVMAALVSQGDIVLDSVIEGQPAYKRLRAEKTPPPKAKPAPESKPKKRTMKTYVRVTRTTIIFTLAENPQTIQQIQNNIKKTFDDDESTQAILSVLNGHFEKGLATRRKSELIKHKPWAYLPTEKFFELAIQKEAEMIEAAPALAPHIKAVFTHYKRRQREVEKDVVEQKETNAEANAELDKPVDWDLPENTIAAADLGAAFFEYMRRLNRQLGNRPKGDESEKIIAKLKYRIEELNARIFTRTRQVSSLENENKRLTNRLDTLIKDKQTLSDENQNLKVKIDNVRTRGPKTTFKMSEVASFKKLLDGKEEEVIDGTQGLTVVG